MDDNDAEQAGQEIIVALSHERLVRQHLTGMLDERACLQSPALGLARLRLKDLSRVAFRLSGETQATYARQGRADELSDKPRQTLDQVIWALRRLVRIDNGGWQPVIGKNRLVSMRGDDGGVDPAKHVWIGGVGSLKTPGAGAPVPSWPDRRTGPGAGVRVGVLDTALSSHPWFAGGWSARYSDLLNDRDQVMPFASHATFVTGLVLSQAPGARVEARRLIDTSTESATGWQAATEIVRLGQSGVDILNLSFVCFTDDGQPPMAIAAAIDRLDPRVVVVAAAGNHGADGSAGLSRSPAWPAALDEVIAVGAADSHGRPSRFTPVDAPWIDLLAPGEDIVSTTVSTKKARALASAGGGTEPTAETGSDLEYGFAEWSGSSFSAALVSGAIAAGTQAGTVSARESWEDIRASLTEDAGRPPLLRMWPPTVQGP